MRMFQVFPNALRKSIDILQYLPKLDAFALDRERLRFSLVRGILWRHILLSIR